MEFRIPCSDVEKLQMSLANWMEGIGMSIRDGGSQSILNANTKSAMKRLKRRGDRGSPCLSPTFVVKDWPSLLPTLIQDDAWAYIFSTS